jgi:hypothetical protein
MGHAAVAEPALPLFINAGYGLGMAALAIFQNHRGTMVGNADSFGDETQMEGKKVFGAVQALPHQVSHELMGQVAVRALGAVMGRVTPGVLLRLHRVATAAELGALGPGVESGRSKAHKGPHTHNDYDDNDQIEQEARFPGSAHQSHPEGFRHNSTTQPVRVNKNERCLINFLVEYGAVMNCGASPPEQEQKSSQVSSSSKN